MNREHALRIMSAGFKKLRSGRIISNDTYIPEFKQMIPVPYDVYVDMRRSSNHGDELLLWKLFRVWEIRILLARHAPTLQFNPYIHKLALIRLWIANARPHLDNPTYWKRDKMFSVEALMRKPGGLGTLHER